jgi:hypothetical protein
MWAVLHEVRSEYAQLLTSAFLLINGPGKWSLDALLRQPGRQLHAVEGERTAALDQAAV